MPEQALLGRNEAIQFNPKHFVLGSSMVAPFKPGLQRILFGMGCFWGAERKFWAIDGVYTTAVGYAAGTTENPTYQEVCSGLTGHNEVVMVVYNSDQLSLNLLLKLFWESHDPTQGMRQGYDIGTQYRSGIYYTCESQANLAMTSRLFYQHCLNDSGLGTITTEILPFHSFYYAEEYHQQYLAKKPSGYCGLGGTRILLPLDLLERATDKVKGT